MARGEDNRSARTGCRPHIAGIPSRWPKGTKTAEEVHAAALVADPEFAAERECLTLARMISTTLIAYRSDRGLSQRELAKVLGVSQPDVVALEAGEKNPQIETLIKVSAAVGVDFEIHIVSAGRGSPSWFARPSDRPRCRCAPMPLWLMVTAAEHFWTRHRRRCCARCADQ